jgi:dTDP-4-dehydrorhamnose 3,5-epimerase
MEFRQTSLAGAYVIELEKHSDERGFFARAWCEREFREHGLATRIAQCSISSNKGKGTLRGMHFQIPPFAETKLVRCTKGALFDVIVDLRPESSTFRQWFGLELASDRGTMLYIPNGFAHGFQTLENDTEILYQMSEFYSPDHACGFCWNDPAFNIRWPLSVKTISERDLTFPSFRAAEELLNR